MREVAAAISGMKLTKAYAYLGDVKEHKQVIPFRRFSGGVGRASQAKQFKATQGQFWLVYTVKKLLTKSGRWPEKSVKFILRLLKNAESNADAKNIDLEDLFIKNIVVQQAPVCLPLLSISPCSSNFCRKPADVHTVLTVVLTLTRDTLFIWKSSSLLATKRLRRPRSLRLSH